MTDYKAILFDLDGTLLPMDQDVFTKTYFKRLCAKAAPYGYEPEELVAAIWKGTGAMVKNDGTRTNEETFWAAYAKIFGEEKLKDKPLFDEYYATDFELARASCGFEPLAAEAVALAKSLGYRVALATNPIFPAIATEKRIAWAGLSPEDFELYTTYENCCWCKPNPEYFRDVARRMGLECRDCLMVGNDATEDLAAAETGMGVFLLTDCLINKDDRDISGLPHGGFAALMEYMGNLGGAAPRGERIG